MTTVTDQPKNPSFRVADRWRYLYETLCRRGPRSKEIEYSIFEKYTQLFSLAAAIGYSTGKRNEFKGSYTPFSLMEIEQDHEWPALRALAWKASDCKSLDESLDVLSDTRTIVRIAEEYADGGMEYLFDQFFHLYTKDGNLLRAKDRDIEENLALLAKGIKKHRI